MENRLPNLQCSSMELSYIGIVLKVPMYSCPILLLCNSSKSELGRFYHNKTELTKFEHFKFIVYSIRS